ncbi:MAG: HDOD domain-containing protein, partial [Myxococcales bacterium]|nr:HDOD domain-containing protein [Myxococcales bacterium]
EDSRPSDSPAGSAGTSRLAPLVARLQRDIVQGKLELPALDPRVARLMELARNNASVPEVVECIEGDPALVGTVLRAANSAMVRGSVAVQHVEGACVRLGQRRVCELAKQVLLKGSFSCRREPYRSILEKMWPNVIATAHLAREIGKLLELDQPEELHAMGLLHNLGELVLLFLLATVDAGDVAITKEELGAELRDSHEAFGATVAESWGLPETFVALMGNHHTKADELDAGPAELERLSIVAAWKLCLSGGLTYLSDHGTDLDPSPELDELGLELEDLEDVVQRIVAEAAA